MDSNDLAELIRIGREIATQDKACTSHPIPTVQEKRWVYGFAEGFEEELVWLDDSGYEVSEAEINEVLGEPHVFDYTFHRLTPASRAEASEFDYIEFSDLEDEHGF